MAETAIATITSVTAWNYYSSAKHSYTGTQIGSYNNSYCERIYGFTVRNTGARQVTIVLTYTSYAGTAKNLRCTVNNTADMYTETSSGMAADGAEAVVNTTAKTVTFTCNVDMIGGSTYYAHIYASSTPASVNVKFSATEGITITQGTDYYGGFFRIYYDNGNSKKAMLYIYTENGGGAKLTMPYLCPDDGAAFKLTM